MFGVLFVCENVGFEKEWALGWLGWKVGSERGGDGVFTLLKVRYRLRLWAVGKIEKVKRVWVKETV